MFFINLTCKCYVTWTIVVLFIYFFFREWKHHTRYFIFKCISVGVNKVLLLLLLLLVHVDLAMCRTLVRRPCNVSHVQYATPRCVARSVRLYYTQCHRRRSLPRHQLFIDCQGCPIHTSSVQLHIIIHVVQLKLHSPLV